MRRETHIPRLRHAALAAVDFRRVPVDVTLFHHDCPASYNGAFLYMARFDEPIEPMTLGNMRANEVRSLAVPLARIIQPIDPPFHGGREDQDR
jgi:hypothetical protein